MRIYSHLSFILCISYLLFALNAPLAAQAKSSIRPIGTSMWEKLYAQALQELRYGTHRQKIKAAYVLGSQGNPRFVRPLTQELLRGLKYADVKRKANAEPYVKSALAWALGRIAHPQAIRAMHRALDLSVELAQKQIQAAQERAKKLDILSKKSRAAPNGQSDPTKIEHVVITPDTPAPFLQKGSGFYHNADQYWSVTNDLKGMVGWLSLDNPHSMILYSANYTNLVRAILMALGEIGSETSVAKISQYLDANAYPDAIRAYASLSLGKVATPASLKQVLKSFEIEKSPRVRLGMAYTVLRNDKTNTAMYKVLTSFIKGGDRWERLTAAKAFRDLGMAEALSDLRAAYLIENEIHIRHALRQAITNAERDSIFVSDRQ